jgi:hypothetical protein
VGLETFLEAMDSFKIACNNHTIRMIGCKDYLSDLAWYVEVSPKNLANGVRALKTQSEDALKATAKVQRTQADQERVGQLEAWNRELEITLRLLGEFLQQHTRQWATA